jgi:hypothetical protein
MALYFTMATMSEQDNAEERRGRSQRRGRVLSTQSPARDSSDSQRAVVVDLTGRSERGQFAFTGW